jgi:hypothetical protein
MLNVKDRRRVNYGHVVLMCASSRRSAVSAISATPSMYIVMGRTGRPRRCVTTAARGGGCPPPPPPTTPQP